MPRSLVLGNGKVLACFDGLAQLRDLYYPFVGLENHAGGLCVHKLGVFVDGRFCWFDDQSWKIDVLYQKDALISNVVAKNEELNLTLNFEDAVCNKKNILVRKVTVENNSTEKREIKVFFHQQFRIYDTSRKDTGYFDPKNESIIHYEGRRVFVIGGRHDGKSFDDYSIGNFGIEGKEGTWKDAEDGILEKCPIEHGPVDSVIGFTLQVEGKKKSEIDYWVAIAETVDDALDLQTHVLNRKVSSLIKETKKFWQTWSNKNHFDFSGLDEATENLFKRSLLVTRTHAGDKGEFIASGDSDMLQYGRDTYAYVWPRDGAFIASALDLAGYSKNTRKFFEFCNETISKEGFFFHKYRCDRSNGSTWHSWIKDGKQQLPIQEDETALVLVALWKHYQSTLDLKFIESVYDSLIKRAADFMIRHRDESSGLPLPSYDLWERKYGTSTFTSSSVVAGLKVASEFAGLLGKKREKEKYSNCAEKIRVAIIKHLFNFENGYFYNMVTFENGKLKKDDSLDISSFFGIFYFGILKPEDPVLKNAFNFIKEKLSCQTSIGGIMRFEGDNYHQVGDGFSSNPWIITTLWCAQYQIATAKFERDLISAKRTFEWVEKYAAPCGILPEQLRADNGAHASTAPLAWSHAEFIVSILRYAEKFSQIKAGEKPAKRRNFKR